MDRLTALLDANVLYSAGLRDLLLRLADRYLFAPLWSPDIHAEWTGSLLADRPDIDPTALDRTRSTMDRHFPDALVTGFDNSFRNSTCPTQTTVMSSLPQFTVERT